MPTVAEALRQHADGYLKTFAPNMPHEHRRVLALLTRCRTGELGHLRYQCDSCPNGHWSGRSCGNRHCPNCQHDKSQLWLAKRMAQLLPVQYYLVTFTVPQSLRMIVRANQRACYQALFDSGAPYVNRVAISNNRIVAVDDHSVAYRFTPSGSRVSKTRTVSGNEFIRGFLQHTLPSKLQRIRYYGWQSPNCRMKFQYVQMLVWFYLGWCWLMKREEVVAEPLKPPVICNQCNVGTMQLTAITDGDGQVIYQRPLRSHSLPYLDSG